MRYSFFPILFLSSIFACSTNEHSSGPISKAPTISTKNLNVTPNLQQPSTKAIPEPDLSDGEDILALVNQYAQDYDSPPNKFRQGHVTPRKLDPQAITKKKSGFTIQLPSKAPITTPAVHAGFVVSSGGFHSKEMYAFKAQTGDLAWAIDLDDDGPSAPACEDRVCVFNTESCTIFAVAVESGKMLWSWWLGDPLTSAPTIANGLVFTSYPAQGNSAGGSYAQQQNIKLSTKGRPPGQSHAIAAFDLQTGKMMWNHWLDSDVMSAPVAIGEALYATSFAGTMYKFEQKTGKILAARKTRATSAPVVVGDDVFYTRRTDDGQNQQAEEAIARDNSKIPHKKYIAAKKRAVYLESTTQSQSNYASQGKQLDAANGFGGGAPSSANAMAAAGNIGQVSVSTLQAFQGSRILSFQGTNINTMGDEVIAVMAETGKELWKQKLTGDLARSGGALATAPIAAGAKIFVATLNGKILQLEAKTGQISRTLEIDSPIRSQPVISDGWLYIGTDNGKLIGFNMEDPTLTGWTQWGGNAQRTGVSR